MTAGSRGAGDASPRARTQTHKQTHTHTPHVVVLPSAARNSGRGSRGRELFDPLLSSAACARRGEWNFLLRSQRAARLRRGSRSSFLRSTHSDSLTRARCGCQSRAPRANRGTIVGFPPFFPLGGGGARSGTRATQLGRQRERHMSRPQSPATGRSASL